MSVGAMITILATWWLQSKGVSLGPLPTALLALPIGIIGTILICLLFDRFVYRYYRSQRAAPVTYLILSVGILFILSGLVRFVIGPQDRIFADGERFIMKARAFKEMTGLDQGLAIKTTQGVTVVTAVIVVALIFWFLNRTRTGKSMRAYSDNEDLALLSGIDPDKVVRMTWIIAAGLATPVATGRPTTIATKRATSTSRASGRAWMSILRVGME